MSAKEPSSSKSTAQQGQDGKCMEAKHKTSMSKAKKICSALGPDA